MKKSNYHDTYLYAFLHIFFNFNEITNIVVQLPSLSQIFRLVEFESSPSSPSLSVLISQHVIIWFGIAAPSCQ